MTGLTGKMGGKSLKTGMVPKVAKKATNAQVGGEADPMSSYMQLVRNYTDKTCEKLGNNSLSSEIEIENEVDFLIEKG